MVRLTLPYGIDIKSHGSSNGDKFRQFGTVIRALHGGDVSAADLACCSIVAIFGLGNNGIRIDSNPGQSVIS